MIEITAVCGKWKQILKNESSFEIDLMERGSCFEVEENINFIELQEILFEDFNIDSSFKSICLSYELPLSSSHKSFSAMNIRNDRQLRAFIRKTKEESEKILLYVEVNDNNLLVENVGSNIQTSVLPNDDNNQQNDVFEDLVDQSNLVGNEQKRIHRIPSDLSFSEAPVDISFTADNAFTLLSAPDISPNIQGSSSKSSLVTTDDLYVKECFKSKEEMMLKLRKNALDFNFEFTSLWSDTTRVRLGCVDRNCSWCFVAKRINSSGYFETTKYEAKHTCDTTHRKPNHRQATAKHLGMMFCSDYAEKKKGLNPKQIMEFVRKHHGVHIGYKKAWRAKAQAQNLMRGTPEDSYINIAKWLYMVKEKNPGTAVYLEMSEEGKFKYTFLAFGASIRGFRLMRRVIAVDGTFLKSKFKGTLLAATAQDGDYHLYPIAFAIVDSENDNSWSWFFRCLKSIIPDASDLVFISDRAPSIAKALLEEYPSSFHGICRFHLQNNIKTRFKSEALLSLVSAASNAYTIHEFNEVFYTIFDSNPKLANYLEEAEFKKWARAHSPKNRYNIMTTNIAESLNSMLNGPREYPIRFLLETIRVTLTTWFCERRLKASKHQNTVTPNVVKQLNVRYQKAMEMEVIQVNDEEFEVKSNMNKFIVNLVNKECTCCVFNIDRLPCMHAIASIKHIQKEVNDYVDNYYSTKTWAEAYVDSIRPIGDEKNWSLPDSICQYVCAPPSTKVNKGRPPTKRRRSAGEYGIPGSKSQMHRCSRCNQVGHNMLTCDVAI